MLVMFLVTRLRKPRMVLPYACGERPADDPKGGRFIGPMDRTEGIRMHNFYLSGVFSEKRMVPVASFISLLLILIMFGVS